ncbi:hypothetical protein AABM26_04690 [Curtobacterium aetherium]|uniref:hypothetical protein n=1 Tax=Curtobacterium aetherium TaxID=2841594 RepID=UPI003B51DCBB
MTKTKHLLAAVALAAALPFTLVACSQGSPDAASTSASSDGIGARWGSCMRDAGFEVQDPDDDALRSGTVTSPQGADQEAFTTAAQTCSKQVGVTGADSAQKQEWARQYEAVAACVRENGYPDFPEQPDGGINFGDYARAGEPKFQEVADRCLEEFSPDSTSTKVP